MIRTGDVLNDRYRLERELGAGSLGRVYAATDRAAGDRELALKLVRPEMLGPEGIALLRHEFAFLTRLAHPNVGRVYELDVVRGASAADGRGTVFFTLELLDGADVLSATDGASWAEIVDVVVQSCRGLEYIHARGLVHHDLKPQNIYVMPEAVAAAAEARDGVAPAARPPAAAAPEARRIKILDLHLAREMSMDELRGLRGTAAYMAPEVVLGRRVDARADLYSLGVVLYQVIARRLPYEAADAPAMLRAHLREAPGRLRDPRPDVPPALEAIVMRLLEKDPERRFSRANDVIRAINAGLHADHPLETAAGRECWIRSARLVGREEELRALEGRLEAATGTGESPRKGAGEPWPDEPRVVVLLGEAGIGKSRLARELLVVAQLRGVPVYESRFREGGAPYEPLRAIEAALVRHGAIEPERVDPVSEAADLGDERLREAAALADRLSRAAGAAPFAVLLEDLHRADEASLGLLRYIARETRRPKMLLLVTARSEDLAGDAAETVAALRELPNVATLELGRLPEGAVRTLLASMLGAERDRTPAPFARRVSEVTGGNPLFVEETVKSLIESGALVGKGGAIEPPGERALAVAPAGSVTEAIAERVARLPESARALAAAVAVAGEPRPLPWLARLAELPLEAAAEAAVALERRGLIERPVPAGGGEAAWRAGHESIRQAIYETVDTERRRALHAAAAALIETDAEAAGERPEAVALARHYARADRPERAFAHAVEAAARARAGYERHRAAELTEEALRLLALIEQEPEQARATAFGLQVQLAEALIEIAEIDRALDLLREALREADEETPPLEVARAERARAVALGRRGALEAAAGAASAGLAAVERARDALDAEGDDLPARRERARLLAARCGLELWRGNYAGCETAARLALSAHAEAGTAAETAPILHALHHAAFFRGRLPEARSWLDRSLAVSEGNRKRALALAERLGVPAGELLDHAAARSVIGGDGPGLRSRRRRRRVGDAGGVTIYFNNLGTAHDLFTTGEGLLRYYERKAVLLEACRDPEGHAWAENNVANLRRLRGEHGAAIAGYRRALTLHRGHGARVGMALALVNLGQVLGDVGAPEEGRAAAAEGALIAGECGARWLEGFGRQAEAMALLRGGRVDEALNVVSRAREIFEAIGNAVALLDLVVDRVECLAAGGMPDVARKIAFRTLMDAQAALVAPGEGPMLMPPSAAAHARLAALAVGMAIEDGEPTAARAHAVTALEAASESLSREAEWVARAAAARATSATSDEQAALDHAVAAMDTLRQVADTLPADMRASYLADPRRRAVREMFSRLSGRPSGADRPAPAGSEGQSWETTTSSTDSTK